MTKKEYFCSIVKKVLDQTGYNVKIYMLNHNLKIKGKEPLGCCWEKDGIYTITIDSFFVSECYKHFILKDITSSWFMNNQTLEEVICHELAHIQIWRHGKKHRELTEKLLQKVS